MTQLYLCVRQSGGDIVVLKRRCEMRTCRLMRTRLGMVGAVSLRILKNFGSASLPLVVWPLSPQSEHRCGCESCCGNFQHGDRSNAPFFCLQREQQRKPEAPEYAGDDKDGPLPTCLLSWHFGLGGCQGGLLVLGLWVLVKEI